MSKHCWFQTSKYTVTKTVCTLWTLWIYAWSLHRCNLQTIIERDVLVQRGWHRHLQTPKHWHITVWVTANCSHSRHQNWHQLTILSRLKSISAYDRHLDAWIWHSKDAFCISLSALEAFFCNDALYKLTFKFTLAVLCSVRQKFYSSKNAGWPLQTMTFPWHFEALLPMLSVTHITPVLVLLSVVWVGSCNSARSEAEWNAASQQSKLF